MTTNKAWKYIANFKVLASFILKNYIFPLFVVLTILAVFVPFKPEMPHSGLDPSYIYSMNEAVGNHLKLGQEIIFTYGPYSSIYSHAYHPKTDHLMIYGSAFFGLCYAAVLFFVAKGARYFYILSFLVMLSALNYLRDVIFFSYPLLLVIYCSKTFHGKYFSEKLRIKKILQMAILLSPLGLIPLIKGSNLLVCGASLAGISTFLIYRRAWAAALISLIVPIISLIIFWRISGQLLASLPGYFFGTSSIISGYTEAMQYPGNVVEIIAYIISSLAINLAILKSTEIEFPNRLLLCIGFSVFLFIAFKGGFVRHDGHAVIAGGAMITAILFLGMTAANRQMFLAAILSVATWVMIDQAYANTSTKNVFLNIQNTYIDAWSGLKSRILEKNSLTIFFKLSLIEIRKQLFIPPLQGSVDIYSYDQAYLLASGNKWNPRPIFQSYQAYTPKLAQLNEQHLRRENAPDNIIFRVQPVDARIPTIDDGMSWPALFDNYSVYKYDSDLAYLRKKNVIQNRSNLDVIYQGSIEIGKDFRLPDSSAPVFAEITYKPTFLGAIWSTAFKPPMLSLALKMQDGSTRTYRISSSMMQSGFFISPLIENTKDFVMLASGHLHYLDDKKVSFFSITPSYGASYLWKTTYKINLKGYRAIDVTALPDNFFDAMNNSFPGSYKTSAPLNCDGSIDVVNGISPVPSSLKIRGKMTVEGWLSISAKDGLVPDDIFVTLKDLSGKIQYINTRRLSRSDLKEHFKQPNMPDLGYIATFDVDSMQGKYELGLARGYHGDFSQCIYPNYQVDIGNVR